jgi:outer membrane receptor protein involved in Fe transport
VTDINAIPAALVERVEVVTGGSSAVYGSDAIAGVTNFILRDDLDGIELQGQVGGDSHFDALTRSVDLAAGSDFANGRGNVTIAFNVFERDGILQGERGFSSVALGDGVDASGRPALIAQGSTQGPNGAFSNIPTGTALAAPGAAGLRAALAAAGLSGIGTAGFTFDGVGSAPRLFRDPADRFNFAPFNYLQTPGDRIGFSGFAHYDLSPAATLFGEAAFYRNDVNIQLAHSNISAIFPIEVNNPYLSPQLQEVLRQVDRLETGAEANNGRANIRIARRFSEVGPREANAQRESLRIGAGVRGELGDANAFALRNLSYEASYFYAQTESNVELNNLISRSVLGAGLLSAGPGRTPLINPFGAGSISEEAVAALRIDTDNFSTTRLHTASAFVRGEIIDLPAGPLSGSLGVEWRRAFAKSTPDPVLASGDGVGFNSFQPTEGTVNVAEAFGEIRAPIFEDTPPLLGDMTLNAGFRYSHYDLDGIGGVWTYLGGAEWSPIPDLQLRGQFQHAVRAPNIGELFGGQTTDRPRATDPCARASAATNPTLRALCIATGVPEANVGQAFLQPEARIDAIFGGNPDLSAEQSDTSTFGLTYRPSFIPGLQVSGDYFSIDVNDAIAALAGGVDSILNLCYNVIQDPSSAVCRAVTRNPADGIIAAPFGVRALNSNIGALKTEGVDAAVSYRFAPPFGVFGPESEFLLDARGVWTRRYDITPLQDLPQQVNECAGAFGLTCGEVRPEFKTTTRLSWRNQGYTVSLRHRFLSETTDDRILIPRRRGVAGPSEATLAAPTLGARHYLDIAFGATFANGRIELNGGVNNVLDNDPPIVGASQQQANTYPSTFDALGPEFFFSAAFRY